MNQFNFETLIERNTNYIESYKKSSLMQLITSNFMKDKNTRKKLLDCIQIFSDFFQKTVLLRKVLTENVRFMKVAQEHLDEEFNHNIALKNDRGNQESTFDPVLEATSCWFSWKMLTLDNIEKTLLMHLVLEASAHIFFIEAHEVMSKYGETNYFKIHSEADEYHYKMGMDFLTNLREEEYKELLKIQKQGWEMLFATCNRIAELTSAN